MRNRHGVYQRYLCNGFACSLSLMLVFQHQLETSSAAILLPSNDEPRTHDGSAASEHIVLIGNSLTRYQFLSLAYLIFRGTKTPNYIVPGKNFNSWYNFFQNTTAELKNCTFDCFRDDIPEYDNVNYQFSSIRENRYCTFPDGLSKLTYFQTFGDTLSLHGSVLAHETGLATIDMSV